LQNVVPEKNASVYRPLDWDFRFLADNAAVRSKRFNMTAEAKSVRYPIRLLRYWFAYHLLRIESACRAAPIDLVEIGVHKAQFLQFVHSAPVQPNIGRWTVVDAVIHTEKFRKVGIKKEDVLEANLESEDFDLPRDYDAAVLLHVLEHLFEPDATLQKVARRIRPGGVLIGGFPVLGGFAVKGGSLSLCNRRTPARLHLDPVARRAHGSAPGRLPSRRARNPLLGNLLTIAESMWGTSRYMATSS